MVKTKKVPEERIRIIELGSGKRPKTEERMELDKANTINGLVFRKPAGVSPEIWETLKEHLRNQEDLQGKALKCCCHRMANEIRKGQTVEEAHKTIMKE